MLSSCVYAIQGRLLCQKKQMQNWWKWFVSAATQPPILLGSLVVGLKIVNDYRQDE